MNPIELNSIEEVVDFVKDQIGLNLTLCDYFTGIRYHQGKRYFNVIIKDSVWMSQEYTELERLSEKSKIISIEQTGYKRLGIWF